MMLKMLLCVPFHHSDGRTEWKECNVTIDDDRIAVDDHWMTIRRMDNGWALKVCKTFIGTDRQETLCKCFRNDVHNAFRSVGWNICRHVIKYGKVGG